VGADWVVKIKQAFDKYPDIDFLGGKVLPMWESEPPAWLTRKHWSPLALVDYGDSAFQIDRDRQLCLVAANLAVRRELFDRVGGFTPEFGRIGASSCEDHEFELRAFESGAKGLYLPDLVIRAEVQKERLTKAYHRKWHSGHGKSMALIRAYDLPETEGSGTVNDIDAMLFDIPAYVYRDVAVNSLKMVKGILLRDESGAFECEGKIRDAVNYIREIVKKRTKPRRSAVSEVAVFATSLAQKKLGRSRS
jgi:hypothetical protein